MSVGRIIGVAACLSLAICLGAARAPAQQSAPQSPIARERTPQQRLEQQQRIERLRAERERSPETWQQVLAAWCKTYPDPKSWQACPVCPASPNVTACNPDNWDCATSIVYAPGDGSSCAYAPAGGCNCPPPPD